MTIDEIKDLVDRRPFRPFSLRMRGRTSVPVNHRHAIAWSHDEATTVHVVDDRHHYVVALEHVIALETEGAA